MCCLPNNFPLPSFLLINKCDKIDFMKAVGFQDKDKISQYTIKNQFLESFFVSAQTNVYVNEILQQVNVPFSKMIQLILNFKDIKYKFMNKHLDNHEINNFKKGIVLSDKNRESGCYLY